MGLFALYIKDDPYLWNRKIIERVSDIDIQGKPLSTIETNKERGLRDDPGRIGLHHRRYSTNVRTVSVSSMTALHPHTNIAPSLSMLHLQ